jgi:hypothetical protein
MIRRDTPIHTFWSVIGMTMVALIITRLYKIPGDRAMPIFVLFMFLGVPLGELLERFSDRSKNK